jgi:hypothetical protein
MALPAIAATAGRVTASAGRTAVSASAKNAATTRSVSQMKSQFQQTRNKTQENDEQQDSDSEEANAVASPTQRFKQAIASARKFGSSQTKTEDDEESNEEQELTQAAMKKVIPRGAAFVANHIATALELSTAGTAFIITWLIRFMSLGWLNVEMIYGRWIAKGKSKAIPPLSWAPIPMPIDKDAKILQVIIIMADVFCIVMVLLVFTLPILVLTALFDSISSIL